MVIATSGCTAVTVASTSRSAPSAMVRVVVERHAGAPTERVGAGQRRHQRSRRRSAVAAVPHIGFVGRPHHRLD